MILILDSPRADGGLNHRLFLAAPENADPTVVRQYSEDARARLAQMHQERGNGIQGAGYLAVSRMVSQVSREQVREGPELLLLCGIPNLPAQTVEIVLRRMRGMLDNLPDSPISVPETSDGLLVPYPPLRQFEAELLAILPNQTIHVPVKPSEKSESRGRSLWIGMFIVSAILAVALVGTMLKNRQSGNRFTLSNATSGSIGEPEIGEPPTTPPEPGGNPAGCDWGLLGKDEDLKQLAKFTGFQEAWTPDRKADWAKQLLKEMAPTEPTPADSDLIDTLAHNTGMIRLKEAVRSARTRQTNNQPPDPDDVVNEWLAGLSHRGGEDLTKLWNALWQNGSDKKRISARNLRILLISWHSTTKEFASEDPNDSPSMPADRTIRMSILTPGDLTRFEDIRKRLDAPFFLDGIKGTASGLRFKSAEWDTRLKAFDEMQGSQELDERTKNFCRKMADAVNKARSGRD